LRRQILLEEEIQRLRLPLMRRNEYWTHSRSWMRYSGSATNWSTSVPTARERWPRLGGRTAACEVYCRSRTRTRRPR
jgi:hypothetical protein